MDQPWNTFPLAAFLKSIILCAAEELQFPWITLRIFLYDFIWIQTFQQPLMDSSVHWRTQRQQSDLTSTENVKTFFSFKILTLGSRHKWGVQTAITWQYITLTSLCSLTHSSCSAGIEQLIKFLPLWTATGKQATIRFCGSSNTIFDSVFFEC